MAWAAAAQAGVQAVSHFLDWNQRNEAIEEQEQLTREQMQLQREAAQHGISWRVRDAIQSGIHPLFALGAQGPSISPIISGGVDPGSDFAGMGQGISRAIEALSGDGERHQDRLNALAEERGELENAKLRAEIALMRGQIGPPLPSAVGPGLRHGALESAIDMQVLPPPPGAKSSMPIDPQRTFKVEPSEIPATWPGHPSQQAGAFPENKWVRVGSGGLRPMPSKEMIEDMELENPEVWMWYWQNRVLPTIGGTAWYHPDQVARNVIGRYRQLVEPDGKFRPPRPPYYNPPPRYLLPKGATGWKWDRWDQAYHPVYD